MTKITKIETTSTHDVVSSTSPWLTVDGATRRALCGPKLIYRQVAAKRLRAARVGGRRELRFRPEWIDEWLEQSTTR